MFAICLVGGALINAWRRPAQPATEPGWPQPDMAPARYGAVSSGWVSPAPLPQYTAANWRTPQPLPQPFGGRGFESSQPQRCKAPMGIGPRPVVIVQVAAAMAPHSSAAAAKPVARTPTTRQKLDRGLLPFQEVHWQGIEAVMATPALRRAVAVNSTMPGVLVDEVTQPADMQGFEAGRPDHQRRRSNNARSHGVHPRLRNSSRPTQGAGPGHPQGPTIPADAHRCFRTPRQRQR